MIERESFLRTIAANPHDDNPKLVYCDWLEENGESDQAAFIRAELYLLQWKPVLADWWEDQTEVEADAKRFNEAKDILRRGYANRNGKKTKDWLKMKRKKS